MSVWRFRKGKLRFLVYIYWNFSYCFYPEYKCEWNRYGNILPLKKWNHIASKYLSCLIFVIISVLGGGACNILYAVVTHTYSLDILSNTLLISALILLCLVILGISFLISVFITGKRLWIFYWVSAERAILSWGRSVFLPSR